jgi:hypothetical protein
LKTNTMLIRFSQVPVQKSLMNVRDEYLYLFNHFHVATPEQRYPMPAYPSPSNTGRLFYGVQNGTQVSRTEAV